MNVAAFTASTHSGAHADAPLHYDPAGTAIDAVPLDPYLGPCLLVDARACGGLIEPDFVEANVPPGTERVLFRTYERFPHDPGPRTSLLSIPRPSRFWPNAGFG